MKLSLLALLLVPLMALCQQRPFQHLNTQEFHYFTTEEIDSLEIYNIYELTKSKSTGGMGENVDLMEYYFSPAEGYYSANWFPIYDSTDQDPFIDSILSKYGGDYLNGSEWVFENETLSSAGGHGYGTMTMCHYEDRDSIIMIEKHTERAPYIEYGYVTFNNGLPYQLIGWELIDYENEELYIEGLDSDEYSINYLKLFEDANLDTLTYYYDKNGKITQIIENSTGNDYFELFKPLEPQTYYAFYQCFMETEPLDTKVNELLGYSPLILAFEISPFHVQVFKMDKSSGKYHFWNTLELY